MSTPEMTLPLRGEGRGTGPASDGYVTDPHREHPLFHADGANGWSHCSLANIKHCQPMPIAHLLWFARPCKKCWIYARTLDGDFPLQVQDAGDRSEETN